MKSREIQIRYTERALILFVWLVLLLTPVLFREDNNSPLWRSILKQLEILVPLSVLYTVNRFVLVPRLLFRGKVSLYIPTLLGSILLLALASYAFSVADSRPPGPSGSRPGENASAAPAPPTATPPPPGPRQRPSQPVPPYANFLIFSFLVVGFDTGLRSGIRWIEAENEKVRIEKENVSNQLALLKTQVSPHFFMNTLNNIHALIDTNTDEAKEAIIKLSRMMRYLLYETESEQTTLKKEVEFLESYINLMKLRYNEKVKIVLSLPDRVPDTRIPPFLFISFIENAFKHGISYSSDSFIAIDLIPGSENLFFSVRNSKTGKGRSSEFSGIGIENSRKRLALLYGNRFHLDIIENETLFTVNLTVPL